MAESWQKEQLSRAYVHANAAATREGLTIATWDVDKDGVDATFRMDGLMVDIQLKCTQALGKVGTDRSFDLDVSTYNKLRGPKRSAPGYLVVIEVPRDIEKWLEHEPERSIWNCVGYYACIQGLPETDNVSTVAIRLPAKNRFNGAALLRMMEHSECMSLGRPWTVTP